MAGRPLLRRRFASWGAILLLVSLALSFLPGFDVLSFHACLVIAPLLAMAAGSLAVTAVAEARQCGKTLSSARGRAFVAAGLLSMVPLVGILASAMFAGPCDWQYGLAFYAAGPLASAVLATCAGILVGVAIPRRRWAVASWSLIFVASFILPVVDLFREPSVFFYAPFLGFFPGPLYDVRLEVGTPYLAFRAMCIAIAVGLWALVDAITSIDLRLRIDRRARWWALAAAGFGVGWALFGRAGDLGFRETRENVQTVLSGEVSDRWCTIRHDPSENPARMALLLKDCGFRYRQASACLGESPDAPLIAYIYRDDAQKARLIGARQVDLAKPWLGEIHISDLAVGDPVLQHEIAHVVAGRLAPGFLRMPVKFGVVPDMARVEGIAQACSFADDGPSDHEWALAMELAGVANDLPGLFGPASFLNASPARAYTVSGSFIAFIKDVYGIDSFRAIAAGKTFETATGLTLEALADEWRQYLWDVAGGAITADLMARAYGRFLGPGVLGHRCAVDVARMVGDAIEAEERGELDRAESCLEAAVRHDPGAVGLRRALLRLRARAGDLKGVADLAAGLAGAGSSSDPSVAGRVSAGDVRAIAARVAGRDPGPDVESGWVSAAVAVRHHGPELRSLVARLHALDLPPRARDATLEALAGGDGQAMDALLAAAAEVPDDAVLRYLAGRLLYSVGQFEEAFHDLAAALALGLPVAPGCVDDRPFDAEAWKTLGKAATWAGDARMARMALSMAMDLALYEGDRLVIEEYLMRLAELPVNL
jgi:tetratricopeptide (TPR) repeat protein